MDITLDKIKDEARQAIEGLFENASYEKDDIIVIGCSSSEVLGEKVGTFSSLEVGSALVDVFYPYVCQKGCYLAAQCCEHLNRSLIIEKEAAKKWGLEIVNCRPQLHAGGSFAMKLWEALDQPVAVSHIKAVAGMDIGGVLIGMHLKEVAVPVRLGIDKIGQARLTLARTRPKFVGGERAAYVDELR